MAEQRIYIQSRAGCLCVTYKKSSGMDDWIYWTFTQYSGLQAISFDLIILSIHRRTMAYVSTVRNNLGTL
jgi:hypothetical protein